MRIGRGDDGRWYLRPGLWRVPTTEEEEASREGARRAQRRGLLIQWGSASRGGAKQARPRPSPQGLALPRRRKREGARPRAGMQNPSHLQGIPPAASFSEFLHISEPHIHGTGGKNCQIVNVPVVAINSSEVPQFELSGHCGLLGGTKGTGDGKSTAGGAVLGAAERTLAPKGGHGACQENPRVGEGAQIECRGRGGGHSSVVGRLELQSCGATPRPTTATGSGAPKVSLGNGPRP